MTTFARRTFVALPLIAAVALTGCADRLTEPEPAGDGELPTATRPPLKGGPVLSAGQPLTTITPDDRLLAVLTEAEFIPREQLLLELFRGLRIDSNAPADTPLRLYAARVEDGRVATVDGEPVQLVTGPFTLSELDGNSLLGLLFPNPAIWLPDGFVPGGTFLPGDEIGPGNGKDRASSDKPDRVPAGDLIPPSASRTDRSLRGAGSWPVVGIIDGIFVIDGIFSGNGINGIRQTGAPYLVFSLFPADGVDRSSGRLPGVFVVFGQPQP